MTVEAPSTAVTILVVEDEPTLARGLRDAFEHHGFTVLTAGDGRAGLELAVSIRPSLVVLDLMLPSLDGIELCRELRRRSIHTPVIMLTARGKEADRIEGLDVGADDYVTKPFSVRELVARARAILRRVPAEAADQVRIGEALVDFKQYLVTNQSHQHPLTPLEISLLRLFLAHPGDVLTRERLLNEIWGFQEFPTTRTVDTFMLRLRQKIEPTPRAPRHFLTVYGAGYRFVP